MGKKKKEDELVVDGAQSVGTKQEKTVNAVQEEPVQKAPEKPVQEEFQALEAPKAPLQSAPAKKSETKSVPAQGNDVPQGMAVSAREEPALTALEGEAIEPMQSESAQTKEKVSNEPMPTDAMLTELLYTPADSALQSAPSSTNSMANSDTAVANFALMNLLAAQSAPVSSKTDAENALSQSQYEKSDAVLAAEEALGLYEDTKPDEYISSYQETIDHLLDQILNRESFSYDFNADPLYQQYKNQYQHDGLLAMQDTMANAAALTGGYGSSYVTAAGSGAYQSYLNQLHEEIPELYNTALSAYQQEGNQMQDGLSAFMAQEKAAQDQYQDGLSAYYTGLSAAIDKANTAYERDYGQYNDQLSYLGDLRDYYAGQEQQAVRNEEERLAYELAVQKYEESVRQWEAERAAAQEKFAAQLAQEQAQFEAELAYKRSNASASGSSSSSSGGKTPSRTSTNQKNDALTLSTRAKTAQQDMLREVRMIEANTSGSSDTEVENFVRRALDAYVRNDVMTKGEANLIGAVYGVKV